MRQCHRYFATTCLSRGILLLARLADARLAIARLASRILLLTLAAAWIDSLLLHVTPHVSTAIKSRKHTARF